MTLTLTPGPGPLGDTTQVEEQYESTLDDLASLCYFDPLTFVMTAYPWGEPGTFLERHEGPDVWQKKFLLDVGKEVKRNNFDGITPVMPVQRAVSKGHGVGGAQGVDHQALTPDGPRRWGDLRVGDRVFGANGRPTRILAVHPRGVLSMYRVVFDDGTSVEVSSDHLWSVRGREARRRDGYRAFVERGQGWQTLSTQELLDRGVRRSNGPGVTARQWEIPRQGQAVWPLRWPIADPYVVGIWLGDGKRRTGQVFVGQHEAETVTARCREAGYRVGSVRRIRNSAGVCFSIAGLVEQLRALGIADQHSPDRSVPAVYKYNAPDVRAEMLRGLLDSDGYVQASGQVEFDSCSQQLAVDVAWLVRSLGGKAFERVKAPTGKGRLPIYHVQIRLPDGLRGFWLPGKHARVGGDLCEPRYLARWIDRIEPINPTECMCITVENPDGLYLTNDFIVTHNSVMCGWLVDWLMVTRPHCQGVVTANTKTQLDTKTWAAVRRWTKSMLWAHWFTINTQKMYHKGFPESWFCSAQTCREENSEAFAGQHAADSSSFYIWDEDSNISPILHQVAEGGMTDGEPFQFRFGNATRSNGDFYECCFGKQREYWHPTIIDSRTSRFSNKQLIQRWIDQHGEESDFVRVRVRGLPPRASDLQFIDSDRIRAAQQREVTSFDDDPLIVGVDFSGGGQAWNVVRFRRGLDARSIPAIRIPGEKTRNDRSAFLSVMANLLADKRPDHRVHAMFCDSAYGAPYVERLRGMGYSNVHEVNFGATESPDELHCANMRAYMYRQCKDWLLVGAIPADDERLADDLGAPGHHLDRRDRTVIESKEDMADRGVASPDDADAHVLTFAAPIVPRTSGRKKPPRGPFRGHHGPTGAGLGWLG